MFRLHIDIPLPHTEEQATDAVSRVMTVFQDPTITDFLKSNGIASVNYRLGHDEDRQKSNYLIKSPSGHVANKKCRIFICDAPNG
jgi:hypothetical protein